MNTSFDLANKQESSAFALAFTHLLRRLQPDAPADLLGAAAELATATERGDVCIHLPQWPAHWHASGLVGQPGEFCPLIHEHGRLYLARYQAYEAALANALLRMCTSQEADDKAIATEISARFGAAGETDWQRIAVTAALNQKLTIISGGPGTGKTTTVIRLLAALQNLQLGNGLPPLQICLAAPTGKAAMRMKEAIRKARGQLPAELASHIPEEAGTLHRLLGSRPNSVLFRHHSGNPLSLDVLVVDEASMIDLALMSKLCDALPAHARLILLGDKDQLASVEAGAVMGDLCADAAPDAEFAARLSRQSGLRVEPGLSPSRLGNHVITLQKSYRFSGVIGEFARAINTGQTKLVSELLHRGDPALQWQDCDPAHAGRQLLAPLAAGYADFWQAVAARKSPAEVFMAFDAFRVLSPLRKGAGSVDHVNRLLEQHLSRQGIREAEQAWYPGRPVLIPQNLHELSLYNGDIGIALPDDVGKLWVHFLQDDGTTKRFSPSRLPAVETAYAMTVHKSQGSEFNHVLLLLPAAEGTGLMTRELVYTAITRAKNQISLWAEEKTVRLAAARAVTRLSGLAERLKK